MSISARFRLALAAALAVALAATLGASAYFNATGHGSGGVAVGMLAAPTDVTVPASSTGTVHVAWTASAAGSGSVASAGYYVQRRTGAAPWEAACGSSPAALLSAAACDDAVAADGVYAYRVTAVYHSWTATGASGSYVQVGHDTTAPSVTVARATGQDALSNSLPLRWAVSFSEPVTGFDAADLTRGGTSTGGTLDVTGSGASYVVSLGGTPTDGTVGFAIAAGRAADAAGNGNTASAGADDTVSYDTTAPAVTVNRASGQADPTSASPIHFAVVFGEPVSDFATGDVTLSGTAGATTAAVAGSGTTYDVAAGGMTTGGTVVATVAAGVVHDAAGNANAASTSADNGVTYAVPPTVSSVMLANASGTAGALDDNDTITIVFSKAMKVSSFCSTWSNDLNNQSLAGNGTVTLKVADGAAGANDTLTVGAGSCAFNFGSIDLGSGGFTSGGDLVFAGNGSNQTTISWNAGSRRLVVKLGGRGGSGTPGTVVAGATATYTPSASLTDTSGIPIGGTGSTANTVLF